MGNQREQAFSPTENGVLYGEVIVEMVDGIYDFSWQCFANVHSLRLRGTGVLRIMILMRSDELCGWDTRSPNNTKYMLVYVGNKFKSSNYQLEIKSEHIGRF